jgi:negative regulator of sigma-B (phosphoserine phosphatase)
MAVLARSEELGSPAMLEWALAARALEGEPESGDLHLIVAIPDGALLAVVDGLGHGPDAAAAARTAADALESHAAEAPDVGLRRCHQALRHTRGVAATVASLSARDETVTWLGVGNVEGMLFRAEPDADSRYELAPLRAGIVGLRMPVLRPALLSVQPGDVLVLATDGIRPGFDELVSRRESAESVADRILAEHGDAADDALVLVARYLGHTE